MRCCHRLSLPGVVAKNAMAGLLEKDRREHEALAGAVPCRPRHARATHQTARYGMWNAGQDSARQRRANAAEMDGRGAVRQSDPPVEGLSPVVAQCPIRRLLFVLFDLAQSLLHRLSRRAFFFLCALPHGWEQPFGCKFQPRAANKGLDPLYISILR